MVKNNSLGDLSSERGQVHLQFPSYHPSVIMGSTHEDLIFTEMSLFTYIYIYWQDISDRQTFYTLF